MTGRVARLFAAAFFIVLSCAVMAWVAGGWEFARRPVGVVFLVVWFLWLLSTAWYRRSGSSSKYSRRAVALTLLAIPA